MKKIILLSILLVIDLFVLGVVIFKLISLNSFNNSLYIVTSGQGHTNFYEINNRGGQRQIPRFDYDYKNIYYPKDCIESYVDNGKVLNKYTPNTCHIMDSYDNLIELDDTLVDIIKEVSKLRHDLMNIRIMKTENYYYVSVEYNVNWQSPYRLYKYEDNELKEIITLEGEDIIYVKEK